MMTDFAEPDRDIVEEMVAARHSDTLGRIPEADLQETCHLRSVTAAALKLKNPSCVWQEEQKMLRLWDCVSIMSSLVVDPRSNVETENYSPESATD